uniref:Taperin n=1 Tax=Sinocyclocheilus anshuiensis TaxID=1608454 RepID=A0A671S531_9TELE
GERLFGFTRTPIKPVSPIMSCGDLRVLRQEPGQESPRMPAPYTHLGTLIKKRYPAAEEIKVIGGYLSLGRSCLSKTGSTGKKLKISFNESSLQSTFEYPSENSVWDSGEDEEEGEEKGGEDDGGIINMSTIVV